VFISVRVSLIDRPLIREGGGGWLDIDGHVRRMRTSWGDPGVIGHELDAVRDWWATGGRIRTKQRAELDRRVAQVRGWFGCSSFDLLREFK
jgi:hypothetical protein